MLLGVLEPASISSDRVELHSCRWLQVKSACKEARTQPAPKECSYDLQLCPCRMELHTMEKGYVLRRDKVLSEASGWQETSLETTQRETCSSHSNPDSSLSRWRSHGVGRDFSDCKDIPGLHRRKPECTTLHQRSPYATRAAVSAPDASCQYNFPGCQRQASSSAHVDDFLRTRNVNRIDWPAVSPDLSCIEHVWDVLGRAVSVRLELNSTLQDLWRFLREE